MSIITVYRRRKLERSILKKLKDFGILVCAILGVIAMMEAAKYVITSADGAPLTSNFSLVEGNILVEFQEASLTPATDSMPPSTFWIPNPTPLPPRPVAKALSITLLNEKSEPLLESRTPTWIFDYSSAETVSPPKTTLEQLEGVGIGIVAVIFTGIAAYLLHPLTSILGLGAYDAKTLFEKVFRPI